MSRLASKGFVRLAAIAAAALGAGTVASAATYSVSTPGELLTAIGFANLDPDPDTINLAPGFYNVGTLEVKYDLTLNGGGRPGVVIDGTSLPGTAKEPVFQVFCASVGFVTFNDLTIQNGRSGIDFRCGGVSLLKVNRVTLRGHQEAGILLEKGAAEITNSTISGNGSGIFSEASGPLTLLNDTIAFNTEFGCVGCGGSGTLQNTIIAFNATDCGGPLAGDRNLDSDGTCGPSAVTADPLIGPLADNGGRTPTYALLDGSPAIDEGSNSSCPTTDARGASRPQGLFCDKGAFERTPIAFEGASATVGAGGQVTTDTEADGATLADPVETTITHPGGGAISIAEGPDVEFGFLGQRVHIGVSPPASPTAPLVIVFQIDASIVPVGQNETTIAVLKNGVTVPACAGPAGVAAPDPCVSLRELLGDGDVRLTVLSSTASDWDLGPGSAPPPVMPEVSIGDASVVEGDAGTTTAEFVVSLSQPTTETVTVNFATPDGTANATGDYTAALGSLTFLPGETSHTIGVLVLGDTDLEPDETFQVVLSDPVNGTLADAQAQGTIVNDDTASPPPTAKNARVHAEGAIASPKADFEVEVFTRRGKSKGEVNYHDRASRLHLHSTSITRVTCEGHRATIEGTGRVGPDTVAFRVEVEDVSRRGRKDTFSIAWPGYSASGRLQRGDVRVSCGSECGPSW